MSANTETTMIPAELLAEVDRLLSDATLARVARDSHGPSYEHLNAKFRTAVAALIERNAELERQNDEILARNVDLDKAMGAMEAERDALADKWRVLFAVTERHAEAIQKCRQFEHDERLSYTAREFLLDHARAEYGGASRELWAMIEAARAEARNG